MVIVLASCPCSPPCRSALQIKKVIAEELDARGCAQVAMPCLHPSSLWKQSGVEAFPFLIPNICLGVVLPLKLSIVGLHASDVIFFSVSAKARRYALIIHFLYAYVVGRWETAGPELIRVKDRKDADYCLGPTHEEVGC